MVSNIVGALSLLLALASSSLAKPFAAPGPTHIPIPIPKRHLCRVSICFAFDESGSVPHFNPNGFVQEKIAAMDIAAAVGAGSTFYGVQYASSSSVFVGPTTNYATITNAIYYNSFSNGGTDSAEAMQECAVAQANDAGPRVIVLLTDGSDAGNSNVMSKASFLKGEGFIIVTVNVGPAYFNANMENIASDDSLAVEYLGTNAMISERGPFAKIICDTCCETVSVCYAIDESGSISSTEFTDMMNGLSAVTSAHDANSIGSKYAAAQFASTAATIQTLTNPSTLITALQNNPKQGGMTSSGAGLLKCKELLSSAPWPRVIVLVTDGFDNTAPFGTAEAPALKTAGYRIVTVGVGSGVSSVALGDIASPNEFVKVDDFPSFYAAVGPISTAICKSRSIRRPPNFIKRTVPAFSGCTNVVCARCGSGLECFVRSGSADFDKRACDMVQSSKLASARRSCGLRLKSFSGVSCFSNQAYGLVGGGSDGATCRGSGKAATTFATFKACGQETSMTALALSCAKRTCSARSSSCAPAAE